MAEKTIYFGLKWPDGTEEKAAHQHMFVNWDAVKGMRGLTTTREDHFWWLAEYYWGPTAPRPLHRNPWAEQMVHELCTQKIVSVSGCASSGKTTVAAVWVLLNWCFDPIDTKAIVTSTSIKAARNRIWGQIREYHAGPGVMFYTPKGQQKWKRFKLTGVFVDSLGLLRLDKKHDGVAGSQMSTIELIAAEQSQEREAVGKLIGLKNKKVLFILDEAPDLSPAVLSAAFGNLSANPDFQILALGNFKSINDPFGLLSTPVNGWGSVDVNTMEWETTYQGQKGRCIRFDGTRSPNVIAGENIYPGLYSVEKYEKDLAMGENTMEYWRFCRSFLVPANVSDRVYSESDFVKGRAFDRPMWKTEPTPVASLDPAFTTGGDRPAAVFGEFGETVDDKRVLNIVDIVRIREDVTNTTMPFDFQVAQQWVQMCKDRRVTPNNAAYDATGAGISFGSIIGQIWSPAVLGIAFGGSPTNRVVSQTDHTPCKDAYQYRVDEIWFQGKEFVRAGQVKGMTTALAFELTERKRDKDAKGRKARVESKRDMKERTQKSPDEADAFLLLVDMLRERHGWTAGAFGTAVKEYERENTDWEKLADSVYDEGALLSDAA